MWFAQPFVLISYCYKSLRIPDSQNREKSHEVPMTETDKLPGLQHNPAVIFTP